MFLDIEKIKAASDRPKVQVDIPEWGGSVYVGTMSGADRERFEHLISDKTNASRVRACLAICTCVKEDGSKMFSEKDIPWLNEKSYPALNRIYEASDKLNKFSVAEEKKIEGESEAVRSSNS